MQYIVGSQCRPTLSVALTLAWVPTHVGGELVARSVGDLHLVTDPLGPVPLELLVPETSVTWNVGVGLAPGEFLAVQAWVGRMVSGTATLAAVLASMVGVAVSMGTTSATAFLSWCVGG